MCRCEVEEYVWGGSRGSGRKVWAQMNVTVMVATTQPPHGDTTTASTTTTTTTTTTTSETMRISTTTTESEDGGGIPDAVPRTQEDGAGGDVTATVLGVLAVLGILAAAVGALLYWRRKQSLKRPDAGAAVVYDRETRQNKDTATMVRHRIELETNTIRRFRKISQSWRRPLLEPSSFSFFFFVESAY